LAHPVFHSRDLDPATLRQPDAIKKHINLRCIGYVVAAGSVWNDPEGRRCPTPFCPTPRPTPRPAALIEHCTRRPAPARASATPPGSLDPAQPPRSDNGSTSATVRRLRGLGPVGMALKLEFGDAGFPIWELTFDQTVTPDTAASKWEASPPSPTRIPSRSCRSCSAPTSSAGKAASAAARTPCSATSWRSSPRALAPPSQATAGIPMDGGQAELTRLATPRSSKNSWPRPTTRRRFPRWSIRRPCRPPCPATGFTAQLGATISRVLALAEQTKFKPARCTAALAVLRVAHKDVFDAVCRRVVTAGKTLHDSKIKLAALDIEDRVQRAFVKQDAFITDTKGLPESDNPDNVVAALGIISAEVRWNAWLNRSEIRGYEWARGRRSTTS
jgi:hypothetical protein